ncbi:MAG: zinc metallopeptidase [Tissierellia bacterium]|jgi:Zn-dependent membrane protease YugP|nr:zinc metallopeptidase [Tissierellia bacterium]
MFYDGTWFIYILPALIFSMIASGRVQSAYNRYRQEMSMLGLTGQQVAKQILQNNGIMDIAVVRHEGVMSDHYDSRKGIIALSSDVFGGSSIASIAIAAHEAGHAVQLEEGYLPLKIRHALVGVTSFATSASYIFILLGLFFDNFFGQIGIILFLIIFVFQVVTLPVEYNASKRALQELSAVGATQSDIQASNKMLNAAALTYVAAMLTALAQLLRLISIFGRRRR